MWQFALRDGQPVLFVAANPDPTGGNSIGSYLTIPTSPVRSSQSVYLSVAQGFDRAVIFEPVAEAPNV